MTSQHLSARELAAIRANVHDAAHVGIKDWEAYNWHRDKSGAPDTHVPHSSQAFCISVWGTLARPDAERARRALSDLLSVPHLAGQLPVQPQIDLEFVDKGVLNEQGAGNPTNVDALLTFDRTIVAVESKLTEPFGSCGQARQGNCSGRYEVGSDIKTATAAPCRLQVADGRRTPRTYWAVMTRLSAPGSYVPGIPCPFAGPAYQVMRNVAFAAEYASRRSKDWAVVFAFPAKLKPASVAQVEAVRNRLLPENAARVAILDYEALAQSLVKLPDEVSKGLGDHMISRLEFAHSHPR